MAANPVSGAHIDYLLAEASKGAVKLSIKDANGQLVRQWSSEQVPAKIDLAKIGNAPEWIEQPTPLVTTPGMHRFVWSLHYSSATDAADPYADGVWAPPGEYTVELTVDGQSYTQMLTVAPDPRVDLPATAYADAFALARKVEALQVRINEAKHAADALRSTLDEKRKSATSASEKRKLDALEARLNAVTGNTPAHNPINAWAFPPKSTRTLTYLDRALGQLQQSVDGADAAPSAGAQFGYTKLAELVEQTLADWRELAQDSQAP